MRIVESILLLQMGISYILARMSTCLSTKRYQNMSMSQIRSYHEYMQLRGYKEEFVPTDKSGLENKNTGEAEHQNKTQLHGRQGHGESCKEAKDCRVPGSICHKVYIRPTAKICLCPVGLFYSQSQNICLKQCLKFAKKLDTYRSFGYTEHMYIEKKQHVIWKKDCFQLCLDETKFTCVTVNWRSTVCWLAKVGFFDVPEKERLTHVYNMFGQRQCQ